MTLAKIEV